jgi:hypothetical protein
VHSVYKFTSASANNRKWNLQHLKLRLQRKAIHGKLIRQNRRMLPFWRHCLYACIVTMVLYWVQMRNQTWHWVFLKKCNTYFHYPVVLSVATAAFIRIPFIIVNLIKYLSTTTGIVLQRKVQIIGTSQETIIGRRCKATCFFFSTRTRNANIELEKYFSGSRTRKKRKMDYNFRRKSKSSVGALRSRV